jgi:hypothetical protein
MEIDEQTCHAWPKSLWINITLCLSSFSKYTLTFNERSLEWLRALFSHGEDAKKTKTKKPKP